MQEEPAASEFGVIDIVLVLAVFLLAILLFAGLFNRESVLSYAIGYNLYGAERVLAGETPYRDFHTLYPPATVYLNAAIFKLAGVSLYNALVGVLVFKALTTPALFLCGRLVMSRGWAFGAALFSLFWLRPNGPFKAVPMHYGALFLALAVLFVLAYSFKRKRVYLLAAGISLGVLALFKHNIGAYALIGLLAAALVTDLPEGFRIKEIPRHCGGVLVILCGCVLPVIPALIYMQSRGALGAMIRTLLFGPGEFLLGRLNSLPSPVAALIFFILPAACGFVLSKLKSRPGPGALVLFALAAAMSIFFIAANQSLIDPIIFYSPVLIIGTALAVCVFNKRLAGKERAILIAVLTGAAAAFMESFPRFAREQAVSAMPFVVLLLFYLLYCFKPAIREMAGGSLRLKAALLIAPLAFVLMGARLFAATYFNGFSFKSQSELRAERGQGVYFPEATAKEIDDVVAYIQEKVPPGGYFFAHSYAGSSFLFLAARNNPSGAQFWGGVGVSDEEKSRTLAALKDKDVRLIVTSEKDIAAERFAPMREYLNDNYHPNRKVGDVVIMER